MKRSLRLYALACLLAPVAAQAHRPVYYGFTLPSWGVEDYSRIDADTSLSSMRKAGANSVALTPNWYMKTGQDEGIGRTEASASDRSLEHVIAQSHAVGLRVVLKPHVDCEGGSDRFNMIKPADMGRWFEQYKKFVYHYAEMAARQHVELFVVGTELPSAVTEFNGWPELIAHVRDLYRQQGYPQGKITYAASILGLHRLPFWNLLDFVGVDGYFPVGWEGDDYPAMVSRFTACWKAYQLALKNYCADAGKPLIFTEIGISSQKGASLRPWDYRDFGAVDTRVQEAYFEAFLKAFRDESYFAGFLQWSWDMKHNGGPNDTSMTVQGKPALTKVLERYFAEMNAPDEFRAYVPPARPVELPTKKKVEIIFGALTPLLGGP